MIIYYLNNQGMIIHYSNNQGMIVYYLNVSLRKISLKIQNNLKIIKWKKHENEK